MTQTPENQQQYGSILTILGENAEQNGKLQNKQITFTHMAIGDANDEYVQPDRKQTALVNELARIPVNSVDVLQPTPDSVPMLKVEAILPDDVNDLVIREFAAVATFDGNTYFHAVGNCARIYVPAPVNNGNVSTPVTLEMIFVITSADPIVEMDPTVVTASRAYVNDMTGKLGDEVIGGKIWPEQPDKSAKLGDIVPDLTEYLRISGTLYPMSLMASGEITAINLVGKPYTATVGGQNVYLLDHRYYSRDITHVAAFWAVGAGDETESIKQAIAHAERMESLLQYENRKYTYSEPLVARNISIAFNGATMNYTGPTKKISFTWISRSGNKVSGSWMDDVTFLNENAALPMEMSHTQTVSIPDLPMGKVISAIGGSTAVEVDIPVSGVDPGDMIRMDYFSSNEFVGLTACCEQSGVIKLYCSNYDYQTIPAEDISITFIVMKNPIHGLCISGSMPSASKVRVVGYTGLSVGIGDGIAPVSGVELTGSSRIYYGTLDLQVSAAYGYGLEIPARNNANRFYFNTFPYNLYNDAVPRRACTFHQLILGGVSNTFGRLCLESASSKEAMLITHRANANEIENGYYEENSSWANDNETKVSFEASSSSNKFNMRGIHLTSIEDRGVDNDVNIIPSYYINGGGAKQPISSQSLLYNGDFINGMNAWDQWGTVSDLSVIDSPFGKAVRAELDQHSFNLQQNIDIPSGTKVPYSAGAWVRTNIAGIGIYLNGQSNGMRHDGDSEWQYLSTTAHFDDLMHVQVRSGPGVSNLSGFVEVALVSVVKGRTPFLPELTNPEGLKSYNAPSLNAGESHTFNIDVLGAKRGDFVTPSSAGNLQNCILFGNVNADDTVTITIFNPTSSAVDLGSQTFKCIAQTPKR